MLKFHTLNFAFLLHCLGFCLVEILASRSLRPLDQTHGKITSLSCIVSEPCQPCNGTDKLTLAHCKGFGSYMLLSCASEASTGAKVIQVPWPLPDDITQVGVEEDSHIIVAKGCEQDATSSIAAIGKQSLYMNLPSEVKNTPDSQGDGGDAHGSKAKAEPVSLHLGNDETVTPKLSDLPSVYSSREDRVLRDKHVKGQESSHEKAGKHDAVISVDKAADVQQLKAYAPADVALFHFELVMLLVLSVSLPIVYWRKIRVQHL